MRERRAALAAGALCAYLAAFPLAALFDRAFGVDAANGPLFALYPVALVAAFALGALVVWRVPAGRRLRRALSLGAVVAVAGGLVIAFIATPADRDTGIPAYSTQVVGLAALIAVPLAVRWWRRRFGGSTRGGLGLRAGGALGAAALAAYFTLAWAPFLVDAYLDVDSIAGRPLLALLFALACLAPAAAVWTAPDGTRALGRALVVMGVPGALGPLLLYALRAAALARASAAIRADWNEQNALLGVFVVGAFATWGIIATVAGIVVLSRARRAGHA